VAASDASLLFRSGLVGRVEEFATLQRALDAAKGGHGRVVFISGEAGIGKSRLLEELVAHAAASGFRVMGGTCFHETLTPYSAFLEAFQKEKLDFLFAEEPLRLQSLFAIDSAGLVLAKEEREESPLDPDIFTSMIRVVEEFLKDTVRTAGGTAKGGLNVLGLGDYRIILEQGPHVTLVAVLKGRENEFLVEDLRDVIAAIEAAYGPKLAVWTGMLEDLEGMDELLKPVFASRKYDGVDYARGDAQVKRNRMFENISLGLVRESRARPVLLTIDDLQWGDPSSIALVHYIARAIRNARVLLVGTYRSEELAMGLRGGAKHPLEETIQLMSREGLHDDVRIERLSEPQTTELVENLLGKVDLAEENEREVFRLSAGNPFFLIELARLVVQEGLLVRDGTAWRFTKALRDVEIPTRVYNIVQRRLQRVAGEARDALEFAAILGEEFTADLLAGCLGRDRLALLRLLRDLEGTHHLIRSVPGRYRFDHAQIREVLLREMPHGIRAEYHRIAGEAVERAAGPEIGTDYRALAAVAYHFYEAREPAKGVRYNLQAGSSARAQYANEEAILFYGQALDLMGPSASPERLAALETRGDLRELVGRYDGAVEDYRRALQLLTGQPEGSARIHRKVGAIRHRQGAYGDAEAELRRALELLGGARIAEAGQVELWLGRTAERRGDKDLAMEHYRRANEVFQVAQDRDELDLAEAQYSAGMVHYWRAHREPARMKENIEAARAAFLACVEARRRRGDEVGMRNVLNMLATTYAVEGDLDRALQHYDESLRIGERVGDLWGTTKPLINMGRIHLMRGDGEQALSTHLRALKILLKIGDQHGLASVYRNAADVYLARGDYANAIDYHARCLEIAERIGDKEQRAGALRGIGIALLDRGEPREAAEALGKALDGFESLGAWEYACLSAVDLVQSRLAVGDVEGGRAVLERARGSVAKGATPRMRGLCHAIEASVARAAGAFEDARKALGEADAAFGGNPTDADVAVLELERGLLLRATGRSSEAAASLRRASEAAGRSGRPGLAGIAAKALET